MGGVRRRHRGFRYRAKASVLQRWEHRLPADQRIFQHELSLPSLAFERRFVRACEYEWPAISTRVQELLDDLITGLRLPVTFIVVGMHGQYPCGALEPNGDDGYRLIAEHLCFLNRRITCF